MVEQNITPWNVEVVSKDGEMGNIDYDHLIEQFGCQKFTDEDLKSFEKVCKNKPHRFLRRNLVFSHRSFDAVLDCLAKGKQFFLYTGRGPSSMSMHLGHTIPFVLCKYLQDTFNVPLVIQVTDDEKFLCKNKTFEDIRKCAYENIKDIIAFGLNPKLTYIFSNYEDGHLFYENTLKVSKEISLKDACKVFGFDDSTNIGMIEFPAKQIAAAFSSSFKFLPPKIQCLIPCAVDQDPYFRLARDVAHNMREPKPASIYLSLLPDLRGPNKKMSASDPSSSIYLNDTSEEIKSKILQKAFSGGQETIKMHAEKGGNPDIDVSFQYLRYFLEDDEELSALERDYRSGVLGTRKLKDRCIEVVTQFVEEYKSRRSTITDEILKIFMSHDKFNMK